MEYERLCPELEPLYGAAEASRVLCNYVDTYYIDYHRILSITVCI